MVRGLKNRHVALVVEDDQEVINDLTELLTSLGHEIVSVPSQEEAMALLETREFCFVLLDLQILTSPTSIKPRLEAGQTLLRMIRDRFPTRNHADQHHLQIMVMSGFAKEMPDAVWCLQNGANDFLAKPLEGRGPLVIEKIENCLRKSNRSSHVECHTITDLARKQITVAHGQPAPLSPVGVQLSIMGETQWKRTGIVIDGKVFSLPDFQLLLLVKLVAARVMNGHGWTHKIALGSKDGEGFKGISNLNTTIQPFLPEGMVFYENDKQGRYRMNPGIAIGEIDHDRLAEHRIKEIGNLSSAIKNAR
ncbi:MAG: response regulator [Magnetococcales bacterium]|nr:response regulator [Magnetococcales bacterium]